MGLGFCTYIRKLPNCQTLLAVRFVCLHRLTDLGRELATKLIKAREAAKSKLSNASVDEGISPDLGIVLYDLGISSSSAKKGKSKCKKRYDKSQSTKAEEANGNKSYLSTTSNSSLTPSSSIKSATRTEATFDDPSWLEGMFQADMEEELAIKDDYKIPPNTSTSQKFLYCYVTDDGKELNDQNLAEVDIDEHVCYLTACFLGISIMQHI